MMNRVKILQLLNDNQISVEEALEMLHLMDQDRQPIESDAKKDFDFQKRLDYLGIEIGKLVRDSFKSFESKVNDIFKEKPEEDKK